MESIISQKEHYNMIITWKVSQNLMEKTAPMCVLFHETNKKMCVCVCARVSAYRTVPTALRCARDRQKGGR